MNRSSGVLGAALALLTGVATVRADEVKIRVIDAEGAPVPNAKVWITSYRTYEPAKTLATDAGGTLTVEVTGIPEYRRALGRATAWAPGRALGGISLQPGSNEIRLGKPQAVSGVVINAAGKPVDGAVVRPFYVRKTGNDFTATVQVGDTPEWADFDVKTDAAGRWTMPYLPPAGRLFYGLFDVRFARVVSETALTPDSAADAKPLTARPAGAIEGRALGIDGKPAAGVVVTVMASDNSGAGGNAQTDADGNYRIGRLASGAFSVRQYRREGGYPAAPLDVVSVKEGETVRAPDLKLVEGVRVEGTVTAAATGAPLPGVMVSLEQTTVLTGADGRFMVRTLPGKATVYVAGVPEGYRYPEVGGSSNTMKLTVPEGGIHDLDFKLPPAVTLTGRLVDEAGAPATGLTFYAWQKWNKLYAETGKDGAFTIKALEPGEVGLNVEGDWALVDPLKVTLPQATPLTVKVRRALMPSLSGLVLDTFGKPVPGADVQVDADVRVLDNSTTRQTDTAISGVDGRFRLPKVRPENTYTVTVKKPGFRFVSGGKVTANKEILGVTGAMIPNPNPTFSVENIVLQELSQKLEGTVRDAAGAPVADAEIYAGGETIVRSDGEGHFRISGLAPGALSVYAAKGPMFGQARSKEGEAVGLVLQPLVARPPAQAGRALVKELMAGDQAYYAETGIASLAQSDPDAALVLVVGLKPDRQSQAGANALLAFARADPAKARERIPDLLGALPKPLSGAAGVQLACEIAAYEPDEARAIYDREKALLKPLPADIANDYQGVTARIGLGTLGIALKIDGAEALLTEVMVAAGKVNVNQSYYLDSLMPRLAAVGGAALERLVAQLPADRRAGPMGRAVGELAKTDLPEAVRLLNTIPAMAEPKNSRDGGTGPEYAFGGAAIAVIARLGQTDPAAALALARRVTSDQHRGKALAVAATFQPRESAIPLLREALSKAAYGEGYRVSVAIRAARVDAKLGEELMAESEKRILDLPPSQAYDGDEAMAQLTFALAPSQPGHARILLEREAGKEGKTEVWSRRSGLVAMAAIDIDRAVELARDFGTREGVREVNNGERSWMRQYLLSILAQYALAPEPLRKTASLGRLVNNNPYWNEGDD